MKLHKKSDNEIKIGVLYFIDPKTQAMDDDNQLFALLTEIPAPLIFLLIPVDEFKLHKINFSEWVRILKKADCTSALLILKNKIFGFTAIRASFISEIPYHFIQTPLTTSGALKEEIENFLKIHILTQHKVKIRRVLHFYYKEISEPSDLNSGNLFTLHGYRDLLSNLPFIFDYLRLTKKGYLPRQNLKNPTIYLKKEIIDKDLLISRLQKNEKRYKKLFDDDITGDFVMDLHWRVLDCNRSFARIFGFPSLDYALGFDLRLLFLNKPERHNITKTFLRLNSLDYFELELIKPDGQPVSIIANILGIKNETGQLTQIRGFLFDNTPRKNLEKQLRESQKMEGLGRLAGGIAHDFNNLLTVINGYTEMLLNDIQPEAAQYNELTEVLQAGLKAADLTRQLLAFSRRQVLTPQILNLNNVVKNMEIMFLRLMSERVSLKIENIVDTVYLKADKGQLEQVILNLVLNARDAMPNGGILTIRLSIVNIESSFYDPGDFILPGHYACLEVIDSGVGMNDELKKKIFDPFFTTKTQGKGTGLGLATVYGIVQQSGGYIRLWSEPGKGTKFSLYFETTQPKIQIQENVEVPPIPMGSLEVINLVEDEDMVRNYIQKTLIRYGYRVNVYSDGQQAFSAFKNNPHLRGDLIISDIIMPYMTGPELQNNLKKEGIDIPFLYMSGYTDDEIVRQGLASNRMPFIHKPFAIQILLTKIKEVLSQTRRT